MKLCFIADANSIHTRRWITPLLPSGNQVQVISYKHISRPWPEVELIDLTQLTDVRKARFLIWGFWLRRFLRQQTPDVLHAHQISGAGWMGALAGYHPFLVSAWGSDLLVEPNRSGFRRLLIEAVLKRCDRLTVPSPIMQEIAQNLGLPKDRISLIPWGIEAEVFRPLPDDRLVTRAALGIEPSVRVILSPRGIAPVYNHDTLLLAAKLLLQQGQNLLVLLLRFNVDSTTLRSLEQMIQALGLGHAVRWLDPQPSSVDMARLYRMSDVVISIPSSDGYGFTVYEAMSSGCPTLISDLPLFREEMIDGVHTLKAPVCDVAKTAEALSRLLTDTLLRQHLVTNGVTLAHAHRVSRRVAQVDALYEEMIQRRRGAR